MQRPPRRKCPHGKLKYNCAECTPCPHGKIKRICAECTPCPHGKRKDACKICSPLHYFTGTIRNLISRSFTHTIKDQRTFAYIGCTPEFLHQHLESQFEAGMTFDNHGQWEIDHRKPIYTFDQHDPESCYVANHWTNLRPLWKNENAVSWRYFDEEEYNKEWEWTGRETGWIRRISLEITSLTNDEGFPLPLLVQPPS